MSGLRSLTFRLTVTAVALVALVSLLVGVATTLVMRDALTNRLDADVHAALDRARTAPPGFHPFPERGPGRETPGPRQDIGTLTVYFDGSTPTGTIIVAQGTGVETQTIPDAALAELADVPLDGKPHDVRLDGFGDYRVIGEDEALAGLPLEDVDQAVETLLWAEVLLGLVAVVVAGGAATVVVRRQLRPLREVAATAHAVAELPLSSGEIDLAERVPEHLTDERTEVGQVGAALNTLLAHVESSLDARHRSEQQVRQFVADASHELRTPLATISGYTQLARRRPDDSGAASTALAKVEEESGRMTGLVEDLLLLARLDAGRPLAEEPVDLTRLLVEAVSDARVVAPGHAWRLALPEEVVEVTGDGQRLHQVVTNLLTNAYKHTPAGTTVTVRARADGFSVHDDGPGFAPDLAESAFERFTRGDDSRTRAGGAGLGLALVAAILAAHGGSVTLESRPGDTTITVTLPQPR